MQGEWSDPVYIRYAKAAFYLGKTALGYSAPVIWAPLVTNPIFNKACRTLYVMIVVYVQLVLGTVHPGAASIMVFVYLPFLELNMTSELSLHYFSEFVFTSFSQLAYTAAFEYSGLARRLALLWLHLFTCSTDAIIFGLMVVAMVVSFWVDNATAAIVMVPIVNDTFTAIERRTCRRMNDVSLRELFSSSSGSGEENIMISEELADELWKLERMRKTSLIGVGYAATIGNLGYVTGHVFNYYAIGVVEEDYNYNGVTAWTWFLCHFPLCVALVCFVWAVLHWLTLGKQVSTRYQTFYNDDVKHALREQWLGLGAMKFQEKGVLLCFCGLIVMTSATNRGSGIHMSVSTYWMAATMLLFVVPAESLSQCDRSKRLMTWTTLNAFMPWHSLFLIGTCITLDVLFRTSGLEHLARAEVREYLHLEPIYVQILITAFTSLMTELCHQTIVITIFTPFAAHLAAALQVHPVYFVLAVYHAATMAFMYPGSSVCNEIVYAQANVKTSDMAVPGLILKLAGSFVSLVTINSIGYIVFDLDVTPDPTSHVEVIIDRF